MRLFPRLALWLLFPALLLWPFHLPGRSALALSTRTPTPTATRTPTPLPVWLTSPQAGQALQGVIAIQGSSDLGDFAFGRLEFSYAENPTGSWFWLADLGEPVAEGPLADWDTSTISDGNYTLRLTVFRVDGSRVEAIIPDLRVRNYTPIETSTPQPTATATVTPTLDPNALPTTTATPPPTITPTLTPLPANPAELAPQDIMAAIGRGALGIVACFALGGIYLLSRSRRRRR